MKKLEKALKDKIVSIINERLKLPHYKIFLFGSRVKGEATERSDIDIGIEALEEIPGNIMTEIRWDLDDLPILNKIDVVDFKNVSDDFKEVALQDIEVIYEKQIRKSY